MSLFRRRKRSNTHGSANQPRGPTESDFSDLLYQAVPGVKNTRSVYESIESGKNRGFKTLSDAEKALRTKLEFDRDVLILEDQFNEGGTASVEAKAKLGKLFVNTETSKMLRSLERAVGMKTGALDPRVKSRILSHHQAISPLASDNEESPGPAGAMRQKRSVPIASGTSGTPGPNGRLASPLSRGQMIQRVQSWGNQTVSVDSDGQGVSYNSFTARFKPSGSPSNGNHTAGLNLPRGSKRRKNSVSSENSDLSINSVRSVKFNGDLGRLQNYKAETDVEDTRSVGGDYARYVNRRTERTGGYRAQAGTLEYFEQQLESSINDSGFTDEDMILLLKDAKEFQSVEYLTVNSMFVKLAVKELHNTTMKVVAAVGYPFGTANTAAKVAEAKQACRDGASRIKLMVSAGKVISEDWDYILRETRLLLKHCNNVGIRVVYPTNRRITPKLRRRFDHKLYELISKQMHASGRKSKPSHHAKHSSASPNPHVASDDSDGSDKSDLSLSELRKQSRHGRNTSSRGNSTYSLDKNYFEESEEDDDDDLPRVSSTTLSRNKSNQDDSYQTRAHLRQHSDASRPHSARPDAKQNKKQQNKQNKANSRYQNYSRPKQTLSPKKPKNNIKIGSWDSETDGSDDPTQGMQSPPVSNNSNARGKMGLNVDTTHSMSHSGGSSKDYGLSPTASLRLEKIHSNKELEAEGADEMARNSPDTRIYGKNRNFSPGRGGRGGGSSPAVRRQNSATTADAVSPKGRNKGSRNGSKASGASGSGKNQKHSRQNSKIKHARDRSNSGMKSPSSRGSRNSRDMRGGAGKGRKGKENSNVLDGNKNSRAKYSRSESTKNSQVRKKSFDFNSDKKVKSPKRANTTKNAKNGKNGKNEKQGNSVKNGKKTQQERGRKSGKDKTSSGSNSHVRTDSRASPRQSYTDSVHSDEEILDLTPDTRDDSKDSKDSKDIKDFKASSTKGGKTGTKHSKGGSRGGSKSNKKSSGGGGGTSSAGSGSSSSSSGRNTANGTRGGPDQPSGSNAWLKDGNLRPVYASLTESAHDSGESDMEAFMNEFVDFDKSMASGKMTSPKGGAGNRKDKEYKEKGTKHKKSRAKR